MPLRATSDEGDLQSFTFDSSQWTELKGAYARLNLRMPCCQVAAVPKTSALGNFFFAHARRGECKTAPESAEHLYCKTLVAQAATAAGWVVTTERPGVSPAGEEWVADVFCEKGAAKLALEIQMSPQSDEETVRRQERYKASGVRGAWFFGARARKGSIVFNKETPGFSLLPVVVGEAPTIGRFDVSLPEFVKGMLEKRLTWVIPKYSRPAYVEFIEDTCWACKKPIKQVFDHLDGQHAPKGEVLTIDTVHEGRWHEPAYTVAGLSNLIEATHKVVSNEELAAQGLNLIGRQDVIKGKTTRFPYCNLCIHCHAPQNNFYLSKKIYASKEMQSQGEGARYLEGAFSDEAPAAPEHQVFGLAVIPREIEGAGLWVLQAQPIP